MKRLEKRIRNHNRRGFGIRKAFGGWFNPIRRGRGTGRRIIRSASTAGTSKNRMFVFANTVNGRRGTII